MIENINISEENSLYILEIMPGVELPKITSIQPSLKPPNQEVKKEQQNFSLSTEAADNFKKSGILSGIEEYISSGDCILIEKTPNTTVSDNDWIIVFKDQRGQLFSKKSAFSGLRISVTKDGMQIIALNQPVISLNDSSYDSKLKETKDRLSDRKTDDITIIYDSSKPEEDDNLKKIVELLVNSFNGSSSGYYLLSNTGNDVFFKGLIQELFFNLETKIKNSENFEEQKKLLKEYVQIYSSIEKTLGERKAKELIYGTSNSTQVTDGLASLIDKFAEHIKKNLSEKLKKSEIRDIDLAFNELRNFLKEVRASLDIPSYKNKDEINKQHAKLLLDLIQDHLGTSISELTDLNDTVIKLLDLEGKISLEKTLEEVQLKSLDSFIEKNKNKFDKLNSVDTKALSTLTQVLGLGEINSSTTKVFKLKGITSFLIIESTPGNKFNIRGLDLDGKGNIRTKDFGSKSYKDFETTLAGITENTVYDQPIDLTNVRKLAVIEFFKTISTYNFSEVLKAVQKNFLTKLLEQGIKVQDDANLFFTLETSELTDDQKTKAVTAFFGIDDNQSFKEIKEFQNIYDILSKYAADPTEALKKQLQQTTMPAEIKKLAEKLSGEKLYLTKEKSGSEGLDKKISDYSEKRNTTATKLIGNLTYALIKLKGTSIESQSQTEFKKSLTLILNSLKIDEPSQIAIQQQLEDFIKKPELDDKQPLLSIGQKINKILSSDFKKISSIPATPALDNEPVTQLQQDLLAINSIASTADSNQIKDFIYLLRNGRNLHPIQLNLMENILGKYSSTSFEYTNNDFEKLINETLASKIKTSDNLAWGFSPDDRKIEEIITNLDTKFRALKVSVPDYKFMLLGKKALKLQNEELAQELAKTLKALVGDKPELIQEITRRLVLRNSLPATNYADVSVINPFPEIKDPNTFDLEHFIKVLRKDDELAKEFLEEISSSFEGSIDRLDAIRQYEIARIMVTKGFDYSSLKFLEPQNKGYTDRLEQLANSSRELWIQKGVLGCHRSSFNGDASTHVEFKIAEKDVEEVLLKEMKPLGDGEKVKQVKNYENALKLFKAIDFSYSYIAEDESEVVVKVNDEATLIDFLNTFGQSGKEPKVLVNEISSRINSKLANYQALSKGNDLTESYDDKKSLLESTKSIFSVFGRNKIVKDIPGQFEVVSVDEVMYSFAAVMQRVEAFKNKHSKAFEKEPALLDPNSTSVPTGSLSPKSINFDSLFFDEDLKAINKEYEKQMKKKLSILSSKISAA